MTSDLSQATLHCRLFPDVAELEIVKLAFFTDGTRLLAASGVPDFLLTVYDVSTGQQQARVTLGGAMSTVSFNPRAEMQFCTLSEEVLSVWTVERSYEVILLSLCTLAEISPVYVNFYWLIRR
jgi:hypothetical protein